MRTLYLIVNNLVLNNIDYLDNEEIDSKRAKRPLSINGEEMCKKMYKLEELQEVTSIYSSSYASALSTAKYLSEKLDVVINIDNKFNERKIGTVNNKSNFKYYKENQEHDFNYKYPMGESFNMTKERMLKSVRDILRINNDDNIAIFTHSLAITSFLSNFCETEYNLENNLILNFNGEPLETVGEFNIYRVFLDDNMKVSDIESIDINN